VKTVLIIYAAGSCLVALRHAWHMRFKLDRYDWAHSRVWQSFLSAVFLWPIRILFITPLLESSEALHWGDWLPRHHRDMDRFRSTTPPPCGRFIRYRQIDQECCGDFILKSADVEMECRELKKEQPHSSLGIMEKDLLAWLHQRNEALAEASDLPPVLCENVNLPSILYRLIRSGRAKVWCGKCGEVFPASQLTSKPDPGHPGTNYDRLCCPQNHQLLAFALRYIEPIPHGTRIKRQTRPPNPDPPPPTPSTPSP